MPLDPLDEFLPPRYRSAGRRPEANNDRTASANAPLSALRGWAAGTAGLPGDIEGLARAGISQLPPQLLTAFPALRAFGIGSRADPTPQLPTTEFYNEYLPGAQLNATPTGKAFTTAGNLLGGTGSTTLARYGIKSAKATAKAGARVLGEELNRAILDSSGPSAKLIPQAAKPMYIVPPQGNLNLTPISRAEILKGPNVQNPESFLNQLRGKPGMTQEGFDDLVKQYQGLEPGTRMTKADFEQRIPASRYNKVDLANSAESADAHLLEQAEEMVMEDRYNVYEYMLDRFGVRVNRGNLHMLDEYHANNLTFEQLSPELQRGLARVEATTPDSMNVLDDIFAEERDNAVNNTLETLREQHFAYSGLEPGDYAYRDYQRLLENPTASESGYFELGVSHPDQMVSYKHYPGHEGEEGLIGHVRGTFISADAPDEARQLIQPSLLSDEKIFAKPNSMVIEEIQSDAQKGKAQTGVLRQAHGTVFKAAIQHALENGADTVYYPTAKPIAGVRLKESSAYAPIYDQQIVNEGLKPLLRIPGVNSSRIGDAYHEITFTPEAKDFILKGEGQTAPGMAHGGLVSTHFDPIKIQQIIARMDDDFDPERIQQIVAQHESAYA